MSNILTIVKPSECRLRQKNWQATIGTMKAKAPFSEIGERIRWHRSEYEEMSQEDYAAKAKLKRSQLANWESGKTRLSLDGALALRETYGLSLDFMLVGNFDALPATIRRAWMDRSLNTASQ